MVKSLNTLSEDSNRARAAHAGGNGTGSDAPVFPPSYEGFPYEVGELDLAHPDLPGVLAGVPAGAGLVVLVRLCGDPIGLAVLTPPSVGDSLLARELLEAQIGPSARIRAKAHGHPFDDDPLEHATTVATCDYVRARRRLLTSAPPVSVVVCTRDRADELTRCLDSLARLSYPDFEVVVVDNGFAGSGARVVCERARGKLDLTYVREPVAGLARARNTGIAAARNDILAFIDDDERADGGWLAEVAVAFVADPALACMSGLVLPGELHTDAQIWFEQFGGHSKGRGFRRAVFSDSPEGQSPLYPLPPFGVGANMAFRRRALDRIGGFDEALGAGRPTLSGEDTLAFTEILLSGQRMAYEPAAVVWHYHRRSVAALREQIHGYGVALMAFYTAVVVRRPASALRLARLVPPAMRYLRGNDGVRTATVRPDFPPQLLTAHGGLLRKLSWGPVRYLQARRRPGSVPDAEAN
jgi:GT2 family glycosyltransferase